MQKVIINARDSDAPLALEKYPEEISGDSCITWELYLPLTLKNDK